MTPGEVLRWWIRRLVALDERIQALESGDLVLTQHGARRAVYDAREGVAGLITELRSKPR